MSIPLDFTHSLTTNCAILLRRTGVSGIDEQRLIDLFVPVSHRLFRSNMPLERSAIREALKTVKQKERAHNDSDSDTELLSITSSPPRKRPCIRSVPMTPTRPHQPLRITIPDTSLNSGPSNSPQTTPVTLSPNPFLVFPSALVQSIQPPSLPSKGSRWPHMRSAVSIVSGFQRIDQLSQLDKVNQVPVDLLAHLRTIYGCDIPINTYRDARSRWNKAPQYLRDYVLDPERMPLELWSYLASRVPLKS
jgi:hypothetical protein